MAIEFNCPHCATFLSTPDDKAGFGAKCPGCGESITVPFPPATAAPPAESSEVGPSETRGRPATRNCPKCGAAVSASSTKCEFCDAPLTATSPYQQYGSGEVLRPHRAGLVLGLGVVSLILCVPIFLFFGPVAWLLANEDLREMDAGRMDPEGRSMTSTGKVLGMIATGLLLLVPFLACVLGIIGALVA